jgi:hypothetical protein
MTYKRQQLLAFFLDWSKRKGAPVDHTHMFVLFQHSSNFPTTSHWGHGSKMGRRVPIRLPCGPHVKENCCEPKANERPPLNQTSREVVKGTDTLVLRDEKGNPVWSWRR